jgi:hypothetical protein
MARPALQRSRLKFTKCPDCGYDVRGLPEPTCPECGRDLTLFYRRGQNPWWVMLVGDAGGRSRDDRRDGFQFSSCHPHLPGDVPKSAARLVHRSTLRVLQLQRVLCINLILSLLVFGYFHDRIGTDSWIPQILWAVVIYSLTAFHLFGVCSLYL